jgi:hypothetical protein
MGLLSWIILLAVSAVLATAVQYLFFRHNHKATDYEMPSRKLCKEELTNKVAENRYYRHTLPFSIKTFQLHQGGKYACS